MSRLTVIVTGANGTLGSALIEHLLQLDYRVVALYRTGAVMRRKPPVASANLHTVDVASYELPFLERALAGFDADLIVNCAGTGVNPAQRDSVSLWRGNVDLVTALISYASAAGITRFIHTGSEAEYGRAEVEQRITEDHPILPFTEYGAAKAASVCYAAVYAQFFRIKLFIIRPFYFFGPGEASHRLLPSIAAAKIAGRPIPMSRGEQFRDFLYIGDAVQAYSAAIEASWSKPVAVYNLCSGQARKLRDVAEIAAKMFGLLPGMLQWGELPGRETDTPWIVGDPTRIEEAIGWRSSISLEQGIERWIREWKA